MKTCHHCGRSHPVTDKCPVTQAPMMAPGPCGTVVGGYYVSHWLGGGGIGTVYAAQDTRTGATVALKLLRAGMGSSAEKLARFEREARLAAQVGSDHIVRVIEFGFAPDGRAFLAMELLEGTPLDTFIKEHAPLPMQDAVDIGIQVLDALAAAHAQAIVHRDLKPANLFLSRTATSRHFVKVLDFGLSKLIDDHDRPKLTRTGALLGTPRYMSPEQISDPRSVDHRADIHAVGVILFQMLTKQFPYEGKGIEGVLVALATKQPMSLGQAAGMLPVQLVTAVDRALARDPGARWPSAREFSAALRRLDFDDDDFPLDGPTVASASPSQAKEIREAVRKSLEPAPSRDGVGVGVEIRGGVGRHAPQSHNSNDDDDDDASVSTAQIGSMVPAAARAAIARNDYDEVPATREARGAAYAPRPPTSPASPVSYAPYAPPAQSAPSAPSAAAAPYAAPTRGAPYGPGSPQPQPPQFTPFHPSSMQGSPSAPAWVQQPVAPPPTAPAPAPRHVSTRVWIALALTVPVVIGVVVALVVTR